MSDPTDCQICSNPYDSETHIPLIIPCHAEHTICQVCIQLLLQKKPFKCPFDQQAIEVPNNNALSRFRRHSFLLEILSQTINPLTSTTNLNTVNCSQHSQALDAFCQNCCALLCISCHENSHLSHNTTKLMEIEKIARFLIRKKYLAQHIQLEKEKQTIQEEARKRYLDNLDEFSEKFMEIIQEKAGILSKKVQLQIKEVPIQRNSKIDKAFQYCQLVSPLGQEEEEDKKKEDEENFPRSRHVFDDDDDSSWVSEKDAEEEEEKNSESDQAAEKNLFTCFQIRPKDIEENLAKKKRANEEKRKELERTEIIVDQKLLQALKSASLFTLQNSTKILDQDSAVLEQCKDMKKGERVSFFVAYFQPIFQEKWGVSLELNKGGVRLSLKVEAEQDEYSLRFFFQEMDQKKAKYEFISADITELDVRLNAVESGFFFLLRMFECFPFLQSVKICLKNFHKVGLTPIFSLFSNLENLNNLELEFYRCKSFLMNEEEHFLQNLQNFTLGFVKCHKLTPDDLKKLLDNCSKIKTTFFALKVQQCKRIGSTWERKLKKKMKELSTEFRDLKFDEYKKTPKMNVTNFTGQEEEMSFF